MVMLKKVLQGTGVICMSMSVAHAATHVVTNRNADATGGLYEAIAIAKPGDTIIFDVEEPHYTAFADDTLIFDKPIHIDASNLTFGLHLGAKVYGNEQVSIQINTHGDTRALRFTNAVIERTNGNTAMSLKDSNFICSYCYFLGSSNDFGPAVIDSENANIALLNALFSFNGSADGAIYRGTGDLYLVNSKVEENFSYYNPTALFRGTGEDQLFYVRNSTLTHNYTQIFGMNIAPGSRSRLDIRHSIVAQNTPPGQGPVYDISANIESSGYNILGNLDPAANIKVKHTDVTDTDLSDAFVDLNQDGIIDYHDYTSPVVTPGYLGWPGFELLPEGTALDRGDPLFTPYEVLRDFRQIPHAFLLPIIESLSQGDYYGQDRDRVVGGRIDIGAYERQ